MSDRIALFTGSFDPVTKGHLNLIQRASKLFDQLYVGIFFNKDKQGFLSIERREYLMEQVVKDLPNVSVITSQDHLAVDVAKELGASVLVRGLRNEQDLNYEASMDYFNHGLAPDLETVYLVTASEYAQVRSSRIRELIHFGVDVTAYVPEVVALELEKMNDTSATNKSN
ncbi:pantetheine-phosphate adenylyltransferase [Streptococcus dentapri]|uniref:Phosphopantetheine adenylyltransferase n=1 Tax=Streptococcus dentapri TaxID=573564 RepID=A0ABV8D0W6_9STRE